LFFRCFHTSISKKPLLLFKSFIGLTIKEFDDIYDKQIVKRYEKHELKRLSTRKYTKRKRKAGAGRPFKLDTRDKFLMLLMYYHLYITYTLDGFLFDLGMSNICIYTKDWILNMVRKYLPIPQKIYKITKRLKTPEELEKYFPGFLAFIDCTEQQIPRPVNKRKRKIFYSGKKKRHIVKNYLWLYHS
jgi:hypothetical protein